jgi:hypothetical protein
VDLGHYAEQRLGMAERTARGLMLLYRRLRRNPKVDDAFRMCRVSKSHADLIMRVADGKNDEAWIRHASETTVKFLRQDVSAAIEMRHQDPLRYDRTGGVPETPQGEDGWRTSAPAQQSLKEPLVRIVRELRGADVDEDDDEASGTLLSIRFFLPTDLEPLWQSLLGACRVLHGPGLSWADCLEFAMDAFILEHAPEALESIRRNPVLDRDGWRCSVPNCTRRAMLHAHHLDYRSHGGSSEDLNLAALCEAHHLQGVHQNRIRVKGEAPHGLEWQLGLRRDGAPHMTVHGRWIVNTRVALRHCPARES